MGNNRIEDASKQPYSAVKYDFQKLLVANAVLRLLIFRVSHLDNLHNVKDGLAIYFKKAIESYKCLQVGSKFLFVCYIGKEIYYKPDAASTG